MNQPVALKNPVETISEALLAIVRRPVADHAIDRARLHLIDWIGCSIAARNTEAGKIFLGGSNGSDRDGDQAGWAFRYGTLGSILEMDDVHRRALLHPGPVVIPAALATSGQRSGRAVLEAIIAGYDGMIRLGRSVGPGHYAHFHNTGTCGGLGSAIAAARLLDLDDECFLWAIGNAVTLSAGLWQCRHEPVLTKPLHVAEAARRGVQAAVFADRGLSGPKTIFEGVQGFFAGMAPDGDPLRMIAEPEAEWLIFDTSFKPWPACRHAHAAIDAALAIRPSLNGREIRCIEINSYADAIAFCNKPEPRTVNEAKFSLQHAAAVTLMQGKPELADFEPDAIRNESLARLRGKTNVIATDAFTANYPAHFGASMKVLLDDGEMLEASVADAFGDSENAMSEDDILDKFHKLCASGGLYPKERDTILGHVAELAAGAPAGGLIAELQTYF